MCSLSVPQVDAITFVKYLREEVTQYMEEQLEPVSRRFNLTDPNNINSPESFQRQLGSNFRYLNDYLLGIDRAVKQPAQPVIFKKPSPSGIFCFINVDYIKAAIDRQIITMERYFQDEKLRANHLEMIRRMKEQIKKNPEKSLDMRKAPLNERKACCELCTMNIFRFGAEENIFHPHHIKIQTALEMWNIDAMEPPKAAK